jgi:hypothetical protein
VKFNKGLDEVRNTPFGFHLIPAEMKEKFPWILSSKMAKNYLEENMACKNKLFEHLIHKEKVLHLM